ncbi:ribonuclease H-like domain-containing protein [Tanacetum coccineum]
MIKRGTLLMYLGNAGAVSNLETVPIATQIEEDVTSEGNNLPDGRKAIGSKWIFKIKYKASGEIDRYLIGLVVSNNWPLFQLDMNNDFLYDDLHEEVYMAFPPGCYDKNKTKVCKLIKSFYGLKQAPRQWNAKLTCALLENGFIQSKNDYSLYVKSKKGLFIALLVYVDDIVITGLRVLRYSKQALGTGVLFNKGFCVYFCNNLISWKSKKQATICRSSTESEYRCLASTTCEIIWIAKILKDLDIEGSFLVNLYCDTSAAIQIVANLVFHEKPKHFEIDLHLVRETVSSRVIKTIKIRSANNVADVFTKGLSIAQCAEFCKRLGLIDMLMYGCRMTSTREVLQLPKQCT